jgi:PAS domain S-box-containing protein
MMREHGETSKNSIEEVRKLRARVARLERLNRDTVRHEGTDQELDRAWTEWEKTFDATKDAVILIDSHFKIVQANLATSRFLGKPLDEIVGKTCWKLVHGTDQPPENCLLKAAQSTKKYEELELRIPEKDLWIEVSVDPIVDEQGKLTSAVHIIRDVTDRKKAEQALRESEKKYKDLFENAREAILTVDLEGRITEVNKLVEEYDFKKEELIGKRLFDFIPEYDKARAVSDFLTLIKGNPVKGEMDVMTPKGIAIVEYRDNPIVREGKVIGVQIILTDITDRKRAEEELRRTQKEQESILTTMSEHVVYRDMEMRILWANRAASESVGLAPEQLVGRYCYEIWHQRREPCLVCPVKEVIKSGKRKQMEVTTPDGRIWFIYAYPIENANGQIIGIANTTLEITERKQAEKLIRKERDRAQKYLDIAAVMLVAIDSEQRVGLINKKGCEILGYKEHEILGKNWFDNFLPERIRDHVREIFKKVMVGEIEGQEYYENPILTKDGQERLIAWHNTVLRDDKGEVIATLSSGEDITERKRAEQALRESEERFRGIFENSFIGLYRTTPDGRILMANPALVRMLGFSTFEELSQRDLEKEGFVPSNARSEFKRKIEVDGQVAGLESMWLRRDGSVLFVRESARAIMDKDGKTIYYEGTVEDITQCKQAEQRLLEDQAKLKSLASELTLAEERERRQIATELHDQISQSLVISKMKLKELRESEIGEKLAEGLDGVCEILDRTVAATRSLTFDLSSPVLYELGLERAVVEWLTEQIRKHYSIKTEFEDDGQPKPLDDDIRVLLFRNVRELLINVVKHANASKVRVSISRANNQMRLCVEDDGVGFDPSEVASRTGPAAGFGLFSIRERLEELGGRLKIESTIGQGSKITMIAPLKQNVASIDSCINNDKTQEA